MMRHKPSDQKPNCYNRRNITPQIIYCSYIKPPQAVCAEAADITQSRRGSSVATEFPACKHRWIGGGDTSPTTRSWSPVSNCSQHLSRFGSCQCTTTCRRKDLPPSSRLKRQHVPLKRGYNFTRIFGVKTRRTIIFILTAVKPHSYMLVLFHSVSELTTMANVRSLYVTDA